jgi:hypothetical protein
MSTRSSLRVRLLAPFVAEDGVGGFSFAAVCAAVAAVALGMGATWIATSAQPRSSALIKQLADGLGRVRGAGEAIEAVLGVVAAGLAGVPPGVPGELILLAVFLAIWIVLSLCFLVVRGATKAVAGRVVKAGTTIDLPREEGGGARVGGWAFMVFTGLLVTCVAIVPPIFDWIHPAGGERARAGFVTAGLVAAALILAGDSLAKAVAASAGRRGAPAAERPRADTAALLAELGRALDASRIGPVALAPSRQPAAAAAGTWRAEDDPAAVRHLDVLRRQGSDVAAWQRALALAREDEDGRGRPRNLFVLEPLGDVHFAFLVEIMAGVQDAGQTVIAVMPAASADRTMADLDQAMSRHSGALTQSHWTYLDARGPKSSQTLNNLLVFTDETLSKRLLGPDAAFFASELERAGLLVLFDAHLFDLGQMRVEIGMLLNKVPLRRLRVVAHAAPWRGMATTLAEMVSATERRSRTVSLSSGGSRAMTALLFRNDRAARHALLTAHFPGLDGMLRRKGEGAFRGSLEPLPLAARHALEGPYHLGANDLQLLDVEALDFRGRWLSVGRLAAPSGGGRRPPEASRDASQAAMHLEEMHLEDVHTRKLTQPDPDGKAPVLLVQERSNLVYLLTMLDIGRGAAERAAIVAVEHYPLREFLAEKVVPDFHAASLDAYLPITPRPREGLRELARLVFDRLMGPDGLPRGEAEQLFEVFRIRGVNTAGHSPTRLGLKTLLDAQFAPERRDFDIVEDPVPGHLPTPGLRPPPPVDDEAVYRCRNAQEKAGAISPLIPLQEVSANGRLSVVGYVARGDHGLSYVRDSLLPGGDATRFQVVRVENDAVDISRPADGSPDGTTGSIQRSVFCRAYALDLAGPGMRALELYPVWQTSRVRLVAALLLAPVQRLTYATIREETLAGAPPESPTMLDGSSQARRETVPAMVLVLRVLTRPPVETGRVAFTLQVTLGDLLASLFPALSHRLAVISPQASATVREIRQRGDNLARNVAARYPRLGLLAADGRVGPAIAEGAATIGALDALLGRAWEAEDPPVAQDGEETIDLCVIEDWRSDLGVGRALRDSFASAVLPLWREYLEWLSDNRDRPGLYHRFGSPDLLDAFAYREAADLLREEV